MTAKLILAPKLELPVDAVTQTFLVVGKRGSGKSNTAARFVEQLHHAKIPFVVLDPVDTWWGLKASRDGSGPGLDGVYVFGGRHADLPLEPGATAGALIAETLCEHRLPMVLSVKHLSGRQRSEFMVGFATTVFQKWTGGPLHIVLEEAHELAPQNTMNAKEGEQQMLGAFKRLWKLGRASGIGGTAITQRPASLSKDITTQSEILVAHRTIGPQDVKAIGEWIKYHGEQSQILGELPTLATGVAYVWAPEFPEGKPIGLKRVEVALRETYDSASTPKVGEHRAEPKQLAPVDLDRLRAKMAATIERAKADDPRELRKEIARLEREAETRGLHSDPAVKQLLKEEYNRGRGDAEVETEGAATAERNARETVLREVEMVRLAVQASFDYVDAAHDRLTEARGRLDDLMTRETVDHGARIRQVERVAPSPRVAAPPPSEPKPFLGIPRDMQERRERMRAATSNGNGVVSGTSQKIVDALAFYEQIGVATVPRAQLAVFCGASAGGSWSARLSEARTAGLIEDEGKESVRLTEKGRARADGASVPKTRRELHDRCLGKLSGKSRQALEILLHIYPDSISRPALAAQCGAAAGGSWSARLSEARSPGFLIDTLDGGVKASDTLFPRGLR